MKRSTDYPLIHDREPTNYFWHDDDGVVIQEEDGKLIFIDNAIPVKIGNPTLIGDCQRERGGTKTIGGPQYVPRVTNPPDKIWRDNDPFETMVQENNGAILVIDNI